MSKSVLISIKPKWCELIARGYKTIEVRKTKPKLETPFKCYIYCTQSDLLTKSHYDGRVYSTLNKFREELEKCGNITLSGKVIGEFTCHAITTDKSFGHDELFYRATCLTVADVAAYCTNREMYGWHISDLVIYDEPKELSEFLKPCPYGDVSCFLCDKSGYNADMHIDCFNMLTRPPQSWCYVEEVTDDN